MAKHRRGANMISGMLRVIIGFVFACLAAGFTMVLFVYTPLELATELASERVSEVALLALAAGTHSAVFASLFALIAAAFGEWHKIGSWLYYVLVGIAIAGVGFLAQFWTEAEGEASIVNSYAVTAFIVTGFVAGIVYWLFAGRYAGGPDGQRASTSEIIAPPKAASSSDRPGESSARVATWRAAN
jgi:drug/metabolite transporter (DMT)-like permease